MKYGFIGLGELGGALAASLLRAGFGVVVHDLDLGAVDRLVAAGAERGAGPAEVAAWVEAVITCLPSPKVSKAVL